MNTTVLTALRKNKKITAENLLFYVFVAAFFGAPLGTAPATICGVTAVIIWAFSGLAIRSRHIYFTKSWCRPVLFLIVLPWIGLLYTSDLHGLGMDYAGKTHYWIYGLAIAAIAPNVRTERFIQAFLLGLAVNAFVGLMQLIGLYPPINGWYCGLGRGYSTLSAYLVVGILMATFYFRNAEEKRIRFFFILLMLFYFFHLVILQGRTGYLTFVLLTPLMVYNLFRRRNIFKILLVSVLLVSMMLFSPIVRNRISESVDQLKYHINTDQKSAWGKEYTVNQDRFYMWYGAVRIFKDNPFFGVGTGGFGTVLKQRGSPDDPLIAHPHNDILYMAVSYGVIGVAAFFWLFGEIVKNAFKQRHNLLGFFVLSSTLVILVSGLFNAQILDAGMAFFLAVTVGLQQGFRQFNRS
ncbi:MAG: O-antigen ligase family protein [Deltaproteobacteria bacterium]|nr:O-antigen ligase family protein [Deltaproteobacteria bacterium]